MYFPRRSSSAVHLPAIGTGRSAGNILGIAIAGEAQ